MYSTTLTSASRNVIWNSLGTSGARLSQGPVGKLRNSFNCSSLWMAAPAALRQFQNFFLAWAHGFACSREAWMSLHRQKLEAMSVKHIDL